MTFPCKHCKSLETYFEEKCSYTYDYKVDEVDKRVLVDRNDSLDPMMNGHNIFCGNCGESSEVPKDYYTIFLFEGIEDNEN